MIHQKPRAQLANPTIKHIQIQQFIASYKQHLYIQEIMNAYISTHVNIQIQHFPTPSQQPINYPTKYFKNSTYTYTFNIKIIKYPTTKTNSQTHTYTYTYTKSLIHTYKNKNPTFSQLPTNYPTHIYTFTYIKNINYPTTKTISNTHLNIKNPTFSQLPNNYPKNPYTQQAKQPQKPKKKRHRDSHNKNLSLVGLGLRLLTSGFFTSSAG